MKKLSKAQIKLLKQHEGGLLAFYEMKKGTARPTIKYLHKNGYIEITHNYYFLMSRITEKGKNYLLGI